jgi:hypothetical protein
MQPEGLLQLQLLTAGPYPEPGETGRKNLHSVSLRYILILFSHTRLGLPSGLSFSDFSAKIVQVFLMLHVPATCPAHLLSLILSRNYIHALRNVKKFQAEGKICGIL